MSLIQESEFEQSKRVSDDFLARVDAALEGAAVALDSDKSYAETRRELVAHCRAMFTALPVSESHRLNREFRRRAEAALKQQLALMAGDVRVDENSGVYREWLEMASVLTYRRSDEARSQDALLPFEMTQYKPDVEIIDSMPLDEGKLLASIRGDLRVAVEVHDTNIVMVLVEQQLIDIGQRREQIARAAGVKLPAIERPARVVPLFDAGRELQNLKLGRTALPGERAARAQLARLAFESPAEAFTVTAARSVMQSRAGPSVVYDSLLPRRTDFADALLQWPSSELTVDALSTAGLMVRDDPEFYRSRQVLDALYTDLTVAELGSRLPDNEAGDINEPATTLAGALERWAEATALDAVTLVEADVDLAADGDSVALNYPLMTFAKAALALRTLEWAAQLVYLASVSGTLYVHTAALYDFETELWTAIKTRLRTLSATLDSQLAGLAYERFLRALASEISPAMADDDEGGAAAFERVAQIANELARGSAEKREFMSNFTGIARDTIQFVLPTLDRDRLRLHVHLIDTTDASLRAVARYDARCAGLIVMAGALARSSYVDEQGVERAFNSEVFADTLHSAFDLDGRLAFTLALPLIGTQTRLLTQQAIDDESQE